MPIQSSNNTPLTIKDVVSYELLPFSRAVFSVTPAVDLVPGSVIDASGALVTTDSTTAYVSLEYAKAGVATSLLVLGSNAYIKEFALVATDTDRAKVLLSADKTIRFSDYAEIPTA
jgi:hypothetical protein